MVSVCLIAWSPTPTKIDAAVLSVRFAPFTKSPEALAVGLRPGPLLQPRALAAEPLVSRALAGRHSFKAEEEDVLPVLTAEGWLVLVGLDADDEDEGACRWRRIGGALFGELADSGIVRLDVALDLPVQALAEIAFGMSLRSWRAPSLYRSKPDPDEVWTLAEAVFVTEDPASAQSCFDRLAGLAAATALARDLVVAPGNRLTPASFITFLAPLVALGVSITEVKPDELGLLEAVGQGSAIPARLLVLSWQGGQKGAPPMLFVGKGITFDSGGLDIKDEEDMDEMKGDMAGAAAVAGALYAIAARRAAANVVGLLALAENMPSGRAMRPGDVVRSFSGLSVEILDTDAEGRLALADALAYGAKIYQPALMVDLATLTGAVEVTLGRHLAGLFSADDDLAEKLLAAGEDEDEGLWRLPLTDHYDEALKSAIADLRNCQWEEGPDALHAARFLQHFVPAGLPWAHLDIAGVSLLEEDGPLAKEGPTGFGVRLLDRLVARYLER